MLNLMNETFLIFRRKPFYETVLITLHKTVNLNLNKLDKSSYLYIGLSVNIIHIILVTNPHVLIRGVAVLPVSSVR